MRLIHDWRRVLRYGWSVRLIALACVLTGLVAILPLVPDFLPEWFKLEWLAAFQFFVVMGAMAARFIAQKKVSGHE